MSNKQKPSRQILERRLAAANTEIERLTNLLDTAHVEDFLEAVPLEAAHQVKRFGVEHDGGKEPQDWFWTLSYLAGKGLRAAIDGDIKQAKHHTISSAALMLNWHRHLSGTETTFRPGIEPPAEQDLGEG